MVRRSRRGWGLLIVMVPSGQPLMSDHPMLWRRGISARARLVLHHTTAADVGSVTVIGQEPTAGRVGGDGACR